MDINDIEKSYIHLEMPDASVSYYPGFLNHKEADYFFLQLINTIKWQQDTIRVFGKTYPQPRLTAFYAGNKKSYSYSNITMTPHPFTKELLQIRKGIERISEVTFTSCLLNLYRDGQDSNGWHADNEKELGHHPMIASISLGEERWFHFKHKTQKSLKKKILLKHGSLLLMKGATQENWLHQIPKTKKIDKPRINLTFRIIK